ncbi:MAG: hypothetical protein U9Q89_07460 [Thermodesulfobacteriota bacterium]|nr:hypothetical protein [Thermodesulfobacteriota bacterium]
MVTFSPFEGLKDFRLIATLEILKGAFEPIFGSALFSTSDGTGFIFDTTGSEGFWSVAQLKKLRQKKTINVFIINKQMFFIIKFSIMPAWMHALGL